MISAIGAVMGAVTAGGVQGAFQTAALKSAQELLAQQVQTLLRGTEPGKGGNIDAYV